MSRSDILCLLKDFSYRELLNSYDEANHDEYEGLACSAATR